jgi:hypothetical protein
MWKMMKKMFITFFSIKGIVHFKFIPRGKTLNQAYYVEIMNWLCEAAYKERPEISPNDWILHHDDAPAHKALSVKQLPAQNRLHPSCSPEFAPNDFWLFPKIKSALKRRRF